MIKLLTITWSNEDVFDIKDTFLYKSFIKNNSEDQFIHIHYNRNNYLSLEKEFEDKYGFQYEYILYKLFLTKDKIKSIDSDYFIFADATDTVCLSSIDNITTSDKIIVSSEINQYPSSMGDWGTKDYSDEDRNNKKFLNSGLFITNKENYIAFLENAIDNILVKNLKSFGGDQGVFVYHYLNNLSPEIVLDKEYIIFFNTFNRNYEQYINYTFPTFVHDNGWNWGSPRFIEKFKLI